MKFVEWIKTHKLTVFLIVVVLFLLLKSSASPTIRSLSPAINSGVGNRGTAAAKMMATDSVNSFGESLALPVPEVAPQPEVSNRMVIQESNLSLLVKNVVDARNQILEYTKQAGGYMISAYTSNPEDAPTSTIEIRIPADKISEALDYFHKLSVKIVSENLSGYDVTDQYVDIEKRIGYLQQTIEQYQSILRQAKEVSDIADLTERIISTQSQIDSLKGSQEAMKKKSETAKITIYLSTDEMALPYAPSQSWRPEVIFKQAVRSLVADLRKVATTIIWLAVYAVIWAPILLIAIFIKRRFLKK
jgi:hypothetical protein